MVLFAVMFMLPTRPAQNCIELNSHHVTQDSKEKNGFNRIDRKQLPQLPINGVTSQIRISTPVVVGAGSIGFDTFPLRCTLPSSIYTEHIGVYLRPFPPTEDGSWAQQTCTDFTVCC